MKSEIIDVDVKDMFGTTKRKSSSSEMTDEDKFKRNSYSKARKRAKTEVDAIVAGGKKMTDEEQKAEIKKRHDKYYDEYMKAVV